MESLAYRLAAASDWPLIVDSWLESYRTAHAAGMIPMPVYADVYRAAITYVLSRAGVKVWVAYRPGEKPEEKADIYGWLAAETGVEVPERVRERGRWVERLVMSPDPLVHYVFVKHDFRRMGIARGLFEAAGVDPAKPFMYTCKTAVVSHLNLPEARWMPLLARYPKKTP